MIFWIVKKVGFHNYFFHKNILNLKKLLRYLLQEKSKKDSEFKLRIY